jgi:hypothetical protein
MLWGTGDHEVPPDGRPGTQGGVNWDDDFPTDGIHGVGECYNYVFAGVCPTPLAPMVAFWGEPLTGGCYANCDLSTTPPILNVADFGCFLSKFAASDPYANCDGSTTPPVLNVADFGCFLSKFAAGCP